MRSRPSHIGQHIRLTRTARLAGEAFAFEDGERSTVRERSLSVGGLAWVFAAAAIAALYVMW